MIKLKITAPTSDTFDLLLPPAVTFDQLHTALEILLCSEQHPSYSFMLMTERYAIEPQGADAHRIAAAFERNPVIRYRNPYPGETYYVLELLEREVPGDSCCPVVQGTAEEGVQNERLQKYCTFTEDWVYRNKEYFQGGKEPEICRRKNRSQMLETGSPDFFRFKKMYEKQRFLKFLLETRGTVRFRIERSDSSRAELLEMGWMKADLQMFCSDMGISAKANWRKQKLAECICEKLREDQWLHMVLFERQTIEFGLQVCKNRKGQWIQADLDLDGGAVELLLFWGFLDLVLEPESETPILEVTEELRETFANVFSSTARYGANTPSAVYLSPEHKTGSWQKVVKGYEDLDHRVLGLLWYYGIRSMGELCKDLQNCYGYRFAEQELRQYLMLRLEVSGVIGVDIYKETGEWFVSCRRVDTEHAFQLARLYQLEPDQKPVDRAALREETERNGQWLNQLGELLSVCTEEEYIAEVLYDLRVSVTENACWEEFLLELPVPVVELSVEERLILWYPLSRIYLELPVAGLGGYSRVEYAGRHQIKNPYLVLNDPEEFVWLEDTLYGMPYETQWKLYQACDRLIRERDDLSERRMMKFAKKLLGQEQAEILRMHCYLLSGNPKLLDILEQMEEEGDPVAHALLEKLRWGLDEID